MAVAVGMTLSTIVLCGGCFAVNRLTSPKRQTEPDWLTPTERAALNRREKEIEQQGEDLDRRLAHDQLEKERSRKQN